MSDIARRIALAEKAAMDLPQPEPPPLAARVAAAAIAAGLARAEELEAEGVDVTCKVVHGCRPGPRRMHGSVRIPTVIHQPHEDVARAARDAGERELAAMESERRADASPPTRDPS
jgi:hypothetical protein